MKKNLLKHHSARLIKQLAAWNNDVRQFAEMYGTVWILLAILGIWSSYRAGRADFSVLYGNHYNLHHSPAAAWWYGMGVALFIQCLILIPSGVIAKNIVHKLYTERKHRRQLWYLLPILIAGLSWSTYLSLNMDQAVRAEVSDDYQGVINLYKLQLTQKDSTFRNLGRQETTDYQKDSSRVANYYYQARKQALRNHQTTIDSLEARAEFLDIYYQRTGEDWAQAVAKRIRTTTIPEARRAYNRRLAAIDAQRTRTLLSYSERTDSIYQAEKNRQDSSYAFLETKMQQTINQMERDIDKNTRKRRAMSIMFNLLSLLILFGTQEVYKHINTDANPPAHIPHSAAHTGGAGTWHTVPLKTPARPATQNTQADHKSAEASYTPTRTEIVHADVNKLKQYINSTYYPRCFPKGPDNPRGSATPRGCDSNRSKVQLMVHELEQYGIRTHINYDAFETPQYEPLN